MNDEIITQEELQKIKEHARVAEKSVNREMTNLAWKLYKLACKVRHPEQKVIVNYSLTHGGGSSFFDKLGDHIDLAQFKADFEKIIKSVYKGYSEIYHLKFDENLNNEQIAIHINMSHPGFYRFRSESEKAFSGQLTKYGYSLEIMDELLKTTYH